MSTPDQTLRDMIKRLVDHLENEHYHDGTYGNCQACKDVKTAKAILAEKEGKPE